VEDIIDVARNDVSLINDEALPTSTSSTAGNSPPPPPNHTLSAARRSYINYIMLVKT
jgi:hypothetical protein